MGGEVTEWQEEMEAVVRGMAHAFSNRLASLGALLELGDAATHDGMLGVRAEMTRLLEANRLLKLVGADRQGEAEALQLSEVLRDALALHALRLDLRHVKCTTRVEPGVLPVRVQPASLLRLLVVLLARASRRATGSAVALTVAGDELETRVALATERPSPAPVPDGLHVLARAVGGEVREREGETVLAIPSLVEVRRRERGS